MIPETKSLLARYEALRRKEFERLTALLDTLTKIDGLPADQMDQARDALFHADHPYLIVLIGAFNTGKSSIINALIGKPILDVAAIPTTTRIAIVRHGPAEQRAQSGEIETIFYPAPLLEQVSLVDTPGLESVFTSHDDTTRRFLHRADIVLMVMLATQAMSASNVEHLQALRAYGKRMIMVVNQIDAVEPGEIATLRNFVAERSKISLGFVPDVWMISAKQALEAWRTTPRDKEMWVTSGFDQIERFIHEALNDAERVRQKLETPLQIARNVLNVASARVREQQNALADYRRAVQNVRGQLTSAQREQQATVQGTLNEIDETYAEATRRGREAIRDMFQPSRALRMAFGGVTELLGVAGIVRRFGVKTTAETAFDVRKVTEPLNQIPAMIDRLGPRLEGRDVKDVDDLIDYTNRQVAQLPGGLQEKVIGKLQAPTTYDRSIMRNARDELLQKLDSARTLEFKRTNQAVRNSLLLLGAYVLIVLVVGVVGALVLSGSQDSSWLLLLLIMFVLLLAGLGFVPLRGWLMEQSYARRLLAIKTDLLKALDRVAQQQVTFGMQMRADAVAPFMRLMEAQIAQTDVLKNEIEGHQQAIVELEKELSTLKA